MKITEFIVSSLVFIIDTFLTRSNCCLFTICLGRIMNTDESLFFEDAYRTASHQNVSFIPVYERDVLATMFNIDSKFVRDANDLCDNNFECLFDFGATLNALYAKSTLLFQKSTENIVRIFNE